MGTLPANYRIRDASLLYDMSGGLVTLTNNSKAGSGTTTVTENTDPQYIKAPGATKSYRIQIDAAAGTTTAILDFNPGRTMAGVHQLGQHYYVASGTVGELSWLMSNDTGYANYVSYLLYNTSNNWAPGWNLASRLRAENGSVTGSPDFNSTFNRCRMRIGATAGTTLDIYIDSPIFNFYTKPCVVFTFDDSHLSHYTEAFAYMDARGLVGSLAITSGNGIGGNYITAAQGREMLAAGWSFHNHSATHPDYTSLTQAGVEAELLACSQFMETHGWTESDIAVYPFGTANTTTFAALAAQGYRYGADVFGQFQKTYAGVIQPYRIRRKGLDGTASTSALIDAVKGCIDDGSTCVVLVHNIKTGASASEIELSYFKGLVDWVMKMRDGNVLDVRNLDEWVMGHTNPRHARVNA